VFACSDVEGIYIPIMKSATDNTMTVSWQAPDYDGGCPIISYALFIDDGITGSPTIEVNAANDPAIRNKPSLREATITGLTSTDLGTDYAIKLEVTTVAAIAYESEIGTIRFAKLPTPSAAPTAVVNIEDSERSAVLQGMYNYLIIS
jgi:hypothetical protein